MVADGGMSRVAGEPPRPRIGEVIVGGDRGVLWLSAMATADADRDESSGDHWKKTDIEFGKAAKLQKDVCCANAPNAFRASPKKNRKSQRGLVDDSRSAMKRVEDLNIV